MLKCLGSVAILTVSFSLVAVAPASAADCGLLGLLAPCPHPVPGPPVTAPVAALPAPVAVPAPVAAAPATAQPLPAPRAGDLTDAAATLLGLVNQERARAGLATLESRGAIVTVAAGQSRAMAAQGRIWHNEAYFKAANRSALGARALGENVAMNSSVEDAHRRLMASPGHRANILNSRFDAVGVAVVADSTGALFITQNFVDTRIAPKPKAPRRSPSRRAAPSRTARRGARR